MLKYLSLALTICSLIGYGYGLNRFFRERRVLYTRFIIFGIGCAFFGRLFVTLLLFTRGELPTGFHVGVLGVIGSFLFFFTSNFGQVDSIVDDGSPAFMKYRLIAIAAPVAVAALYFVRIRIVGFDASRIVYAVEAAVIAQAAYFHLKHLLIPDVEYGMVSCLRMHNLLALIYAAFCMIEAILSAGPFPAVLTVITYVVLCAVMLAFVPVLDRGVKRWTT